MSAPRDDHDLAARFVLDDGPGPARRLAAGQAAALVEAALAAHAAAAIPPARRSWRRLAVAAAVVVLVSGAAAAALWRIARAPAPTTVRLPPPAPRAVQVPPPPASAPAPAPPTSAPASATASAPAATAPVDVAPPSVVAPTGGATAATPKRPATAEELLARANALRGQRRWREAADLYGRVATTHRGTSAAHVALVASGSIQLEHLGDPRGARQRFTAALRARPTGPVAEEARWGTAEACRKLRDRPGEVQALRAFLKAHPRSLMRDAAAARLRALGETP
jgi:hypothetical protein